MLLESTLDSERHKRSSLAHGKEDLSICIDAIRVALQQVLVLLRFRRIIRKYTPVRILIFKLVSPAVVVYFALLLFGEGKTHRFKLPVEELYLLIMV